jgi:hypothetical protein
VLPRYGVSFALPGAWTAHDEREPGFHRLFDGAFGPHVRFAAVDEGSGRFTMDFRFEVVAAEPGWTLRQEARSVASQWVHSEGVAIVGSLNDFVQLPAGRAWRLRVTMERAANGGDNVSLRLYMFLRHHRLYIFRYQLLQVLEAKYVATFMKSARSIRFTR